MKNFKDIFNKHCTKSAFYAMKEPKGITLIVLIITIVVMLILAGITIANITGGDGVLEQAYDKRDEATIANEKQIISNAVITATNENKYDELTESNLRSALNSFASNISSLSTNGPWRVTSDKTGIEYLITQSYDVIPMLGNTGTRTEMNVQVGDFVNYDAGTWTQEEIDKLGNLYSGEDLPISSDSYYKFGGFKVGRSRNTCITPYHIYDNIFTGGWRILKVNTDGSINIIHAGTTESYYLPNSSNSAYKSQYILTGTINNDGISAWEYNNIPIRDWSMYENNHYTIKNSARLVEFNEINNISSSNSLRKTDSYYWIPLACEDTNMWYVNFQSSLIHSFSDRNFGIRPVVTLKAECLFQNVNDENTTTHETPETAWNLVI